MSRRWGRLGECATLSPLGQLNAADLACGSGGVRLIGPADKVELATRERGPRMYEMQGPRLVDQRKLADCPGEWSAGAIGEPHALVVLPPVQDTRKSPGCPVLSRSPSRLWVVPVFAGREVLRLISAAHKTFRGLISRFFCYPPGCPPNELTSPQNSKLSTVVIHSCGANRTHSDAAVLGGADQVRHRVA